MRILLYIICLLVFSLGNAQSLDTNYNIKWLDTDDELKQLSVRNCVQDDLGFLWIATELGLYRYDGKSVSLPQNNNYPSINTKRIFCLSKNYDTNKIYFITYPDRILYSISNGTIKKIKDFNKVGSIQTQTSFFKKKPNYDKIVEIIKENYFFNSLQDFSFSSVKTKNIFYYFYSDYLRCIDTKGLETKIKRIKTLHYSFLKFENTILGLGLNKIDLFEKDKIKNTSINCDGIINSYLNRNEINNPYMRIFHSNKRYFLNFNNNIYEILYKDNRLYTQFLFKNQLIDISGLYYSKNEESFYLSSFSKGLIIVKPKRINVFTTKNNILDCNYAVVENNNTWYSYNGWVYNRFKNQYRINKNRFFFRNMRFLLNFKNNYYLQESDSNFRSILNGVSFAPLKLNKKFDYVTSSTYLKKKLWLSSLKNIGCFIGDSIVIDKTIEKIITTDRDINTITNFKNNLIIGTTKGVYKYNPGTKKIVLIPGIENVNARYVKQIDTNSFWVGCYGDGLFIVKNNKVFKVIDKNIELNTANAIEEDKNGNLWISTNNGLLTIAKPTIIKNTLNKVPIKFYRFTIEDGLLTNEFNGGGSHPSLKTHDGIIGFPSMNGFVWFNPKKIQKQLFSRGIIIEKVEVNDTIVIAPKNNAYWIPSEAEVLSFNFIYSYYFNRENLTVAYRFEEQENWTTIKGNSFQIGRYKKGIHKLLIRITTNGFNENQGAVKSIILNFEPRYYETFWFWLLIEISVILLVFFSYFIGLNLKKKKEKLLKNKIKEKTSELRSTVLELESYKISITESLNEKNILLKEVHHRVKNNLQLVMSILNIQASDKENISIESFIEKGRSRIDSMVLIHENLYQKEDIGNIDFKTYTQSLVENIRITYGEDSDRIAVPINLNNVFFNIQTSIPLGLIINELVTNSFKHGFPNGKTGEIAISIEQIDDANYKLVIQDTGIGFPKDKIEKKSIGLELVSLLVLQLKGELIMDSKKGTVFEINFTTM